MTVRFESDPAETIDSIVDFIEGMNTEGSGRTWLVGFLQFIDSFARPNVTYALCNHAEFAKDGLSCITYNGWVIAFRMTKDELVVYAVVRGNILT